jgi:hypothetical protein
MTKNEAIEFLVTKLEADEPVFILRGRDRLACKAIAQWICEAERCRVNESKIRSAENVFLEFLRYEPSRLPD